MGLNIGANPISDMYVGENACDRIYKGSDLLFDANSEIEGLPPIYFQSRANAALKNYKIYGKTETIGGVDTGVGEQTSGTEPAGYKIPLTVTNGAQSDTYPIYIGDTQLMDEEYVDYEEQKVYKRTENLLNPTTAETFSATNLAGKNAWTRYAGVGSVLRVPCDSNTEYTLKFYGENPESIFRVSTVATNEVPNPWIGATVTVSDLVKTTNVHQATFTTNSEARYLLFQPATIVNSLVLCKGDTAPASYIPYLQPTDPPSPLPEITVYKGNNTITSSITVGEIYLTGRINNQPPRDAGYDEATFLDITGGTTPKQLINLGQNWFNTTPIPNNLNDGNYLVFAHKRAYDPNTCDLFIVFYPASITDITLTYNSQWDSWSIPAGGYGDFTLNRSGTFPNNITASGHMQNNNNIGINNTYFVQDYKNIFTNFATLHIGSVTIPPYTAYNPI